MMVFNTELIEKKVVATSSPFAMEGTERSALKHKDVALDLI